MLELLYPLSNHHIPFQLLLSMTLQHSDSPFVEQLIAQRDRYFAYIEQYESQASYARQQLAHINALLLEQYLPASDPSPIAITATRQEPSYLPALTSGTAAPEIDSEANPPAIAKPRSKPPQPATVAPAAKAKPAADRKRPGSQLQLPLLTPYAHLSKIAAVGQVLQEHRGSNVKPETIIQTIYGELKAAELKAERPRMRATLNHGARKGLWSKSKGRGGDYSLEQPKSKTAVKKPPSNAKRSKSPKPAQPKSQPTLKRTVVKSAPGKGKARGQSLMEQVIDVMLAHPRQVMTSEVVAKEIFGSLPSREWATVRKRISGIFSQGVKEEKWQRVPNEKGAYIFQ